MRILIIIFMLPICSFAADEDTIIKRFENYKVMNAALEVIKSNGYSASPKIKFNLERERLNLPTVLDLKGSKNFMSLVLEPAREEYFDYDDSVPEAYQKAINFIPHKCASIPNKDIIPDCINYWNISTELWLNSQILGLFHRSEAYRRIEQKDIEIEVAKTVIEALKAVVNE